MTRRGLIQSAFLMALRLGTGAAAEEVWQTLPPTPIRPPAEVEGKAPVNGVEIYYAEYGSGQPVILLHGGLGNSDYWGDLIPTLAPHYRVITMDSRGHGRSTRDDAQPYGYDPMASDVIGLMDHLKLDKADIVGWSDGAASRVSRERQPGADAAASSSAGGSGSACTTRSTLVARVSAT